MSNSKSNVIENEGQETTEANVVKEGKIYKANSAELCPAQMASNFNKAGCKAAEFKFDGVNYIVDSDSDDVGVVNKLTLTRKK